MSPIRLPNRDEFFRQVFFEEIFYISRCGNRHKAAFFQKGQEFGQHTPVVAKIVIGIHTYDHVKMLVNKGKLFCRA